MFAHLFLRAISLSLPQRRVAVVACGAVSFVRVASPHVLGLSVSCSRVLLLSWFQDREYVIAEPLFI